MMMLLAVVAAVVVVVVADALSQPATVAATQGHHGRQSGHQLRQGDQQAVLRLHQRGGSICGKMAACMAFQAASGYV